MDYYSQKELVNKTTSEVFILQEQHASIEEIFRCIDSCKKQLSDPILVYQLNLLREDCEKDTLKQ